MENKEVVDSAEETIRIATAQLENGTVAEGRGGASAKNEIGIGQAEGQNLT